jgi:hypothetical protein
VEEVVQLGLGVVADRLVRVEEARLGEDPHGPPTVRLVPGDVADREAAHEAADNERLQGVAAGDAEAEQPGGKPLVSARSLGRSRLTCASCGLSYGQPAPGAGA